MKKKLKEFKVREYGITERITVLDNGILEIHSTRLGFPIQFGITDELREFLRNI